MQVVSNEKKAPLLRFQEFTDEWKPKKLGELGQFKKGGGLSKSDLSEEGRPCILYGELYTRYNAVINKVFSKTDVQLKNDVIGQINDVLIPSSGETAIDIACASALEVDNILLGGDLNLFRSNKNISGSFISYQINSSRKKNLAKLAQGASVVHLYNDSLKNLMIMLPSKEEQQKIASFFSLLDQKIEKQQEKIEQLELFKKGLMQKIFSQEIRFNGFNKPWRMKNLTEITDINPKTNELPETFNYIDLESVEKGRLVKEITINKKDAPSRAQRLLNKGDILFQTVRPYQMNNYHFLKENHLPTVASTGYAQLRAKESPKFLFQLIHTPKFVKEVLIRCTGSNYPAINSTDLAEIEVRIPDIQEQEKIASFLSSVDLKIEMEKVKLESLIKLKKGLLQQMFI